VRPFHGGCFAAGHGLIICCERSSLLPKCMINKEHKHLLMYLARHFLCTPSGLFAILCTALGGYSDKGQVSYPK
jgi:hypothetical protein